MKIKVLSPLLMVDILTLTLVSSVFYFHSQLIQIVIGLPFILFMPGYALIKCIFVKKENANQLEVLALSAAISVSMVALVGFSLNFTDLGIRIGPVVDVVATLTVLFSMVAFARGSPIFIEWHFNIPSWDGSTLNKSLSSILVALILFASGALCYTIVKNNAVESYTEFYLLGHDGDARNYPSIFIIKNNQVTNVFYGEKAFQEEQRFGQVTLGFVNHEKQGETFVIVMTIDGVSSTMLYSGLDVDHLSIDLLPEEKWEGIIGFSPKVLGDNQMVQFTLYKKNIDTPINDLRLLVNAVPDEPTTTSE